MEPQEDREGRWFGKLVSLLVKKLVMHVVICEDEAHISSYLEYTS